MKACKVYIEKIMLCLDGQLPEQEEQELWEHLEVCEGCRSLYRTYENIDRGILAMEEEPPEGLKEAVMREIRRERERTRPSFYLKRMKFSLAALAACLVLLVTGKYINVSFGAQEPKGDQANRIETMAIEAADDPVVMEDTALIPAYDADTVEEAAMEQAQEDGIMLQGRSSTWEEMASVLDALNQDGYRGDLVELFDLTEGDIFDRFPEAETLLISSGDKVYQIPWTAFDAVEWELSYGNVVSTDEVGDWVYLWIG